jgi:hypothetical protein
LQKVLVSYHGTIEKTTLELCWYFSILACGLHHQKSTLQPSKEYTSPSKEYTSPSKEYISKKTLRYSPWYHWAVAIKVFPKKDLKNDLKNVLFKICRHLWITI